MNQLVTIKTMHDVLVQEGVGRLEQILLDRPQSDAPLYHNFGPGLYIREVHMPAGNVAVGHYQKFDQWNVFLKGRVLMLNEDGSTTELIAPMQFTGKPGRKVGYILEDVVWQNVYPNPDNEHDVEKLEAKWIDKSQQWQAIEATRIDALRMKHELDRQDFKKAIQELGFTEEIVRAQSENESDRIDIPAHRVQVGLSPIEGKGLFATAEIKAGEIILPARLYGKRTIAGRYTNHSVNPNAQMVAAPGGDIALVAIKDLAGCKAGQLGDEITVDYRQARAVALSMDLQ